MLIATRFKNCNITALLLRCANGGTTAVEALGCTKNKVKNNPSEQKPIKQEQQISTITKNN
jgi:hypothetical protein